MTTLIAHRGFCRDVPENTLPAFEAALAVADGIELDVRIARCGTPVVAHDDSLSRIYRVHKSINEVTFFELKSLSPWERSDTIHTNLYPPSLEEVLAVIPADFPLNIEIKAPKVERRTPTRAVAQVLDDWPHDPLISCFNPLELARMAVYRRRSKLALLFYGESNFALRQAMAAPVLDVANLDALHPHWKMVSPDLIERAHDRGWAVNVWTVNDPDRASWLAREGVDGLITDVPDELREVLGG